MWRRASVQDRAQLWQQSEVKVARAEMSAGERVRMLRRKFEARRSDQGGTLPPQQGATLPSDAATLNVTSGSPADSSPRPNPTAHARVATPTPFRIESGVSIGSDMTHRSVRHSTELTAAPSSAMGGGHEGPPRALNSDSESHVDDELGHTAHTTSPAGGASRTADDLSSTAQTAGASDTAAPADSGSHLAELRSIKAHTVLAGSSTDHVALGRMGPPQGQTGHSQLFTSVTSQRSVSKNHVASKQQLNQCWLHVTCSVLPATIQGPRLTPSFETHWSMMR